MNTSPLGKLITAVASVIGLLLALVGVILLISAIQAYIANDTFENVPFEQALLAIGFLGIPTSVVFLYKTYRSIQLGRSRYGLPDSPAQSFALIVLTATTTILTIAAFVIVATVF